MEIVERNLRRNECFYIPAHYINCLKTLRVFSARMDCLKTCGSHRKANSSTWKKDFSRNVEIRCEELFFQQNFQPEDQALHWVFSNMTSRWIKYRNKWWPKFPNLLNKRKNRTRFAISWIMNLVYLSLLKGNIRETFFFESLNPEWNLGGEFFKPDQKFKVKKALYKIEHMFFKASLIKNRFVHKSLWFSVQEINIAT